MSNTPITTIDYGTQPLAHGVTVTRSPNNVRVVVRATSGRVLAIVPGLIIGIGLSAGLFFLMCWRTLGTPEFQYASLLVPGVIFLLTMLTLVPQVLRLIFPVEFEVTPQVLTIRWRVLTEMRSQSWARATILDIRAEKTKIINQTFKKWALLLRGKNGCDQAIFRSGSAQLVVIARALQEAMGIDGNEIEAMKVQAPRGCRYLRRNRSDGIVIVVRPSHRISIGLPLFAVIGTGGFWLLHFLLAQATENMSGIMGIFSSIVLSTVAIVAAWLAVWVAINKLRRTTVLAADTQWVQAVETSLVRPLNVNWNNKDVSAIRSIPDPDRKGCALLEIVPASGGPLHLLHGENVASIEWVVTVMNLARSQTIKTESTPDTALAPAHTLPPADGPGLR